MYRDILYYSYLDVAIFAISYRDFSTTGIISVVNFGINKRLVFDFTINGIPINRHRMQAVCVDDSYSAAEITIFSAGHYQVTNSKLERYLAEYTYNPSTGGNLVTIDQIG